jgi:hypothetical protein
MPLIAALLLLAPALRSQEGPLELPEARLRDLVREAREAVERAAGRTFRAPPSVKLSTRAEVEAVLEAELEPQLAALRADASPEERKRLAAGMARAYGRFLVGKFAWKDKVVHLMPGTLARLAEDLGRPEVNDLRLLKVVLVHELVHALDEQEHGLPSRAAQVKSPEEMEILNALVEGHAQHETRKVFEAAGRPQDFEAYERLILAGPEGLGEGERFLAEVMSQSLRFAYLDGKAFFDGLAKTGRKTYVADAFARPPTD